MIIQNLQNVLGVACINDLNKKQYNANCGSCTKLTPEAVRMAIKNRNPEYKGVYILPYNTHKRTFGQTEEYKIGQKIYIRVCDEIIEGYIEKVGDVEALAIKTSMSSNSHAALDYFQNTEKKTESSEKTQIELYSEKAYETMIKGDNESFFKVVSGFLEGFSEGFKTIQEDLKNLVNLVDQPIKAIRDMITGVWDTLTGALKFTTGIVAMDWQGMTDVLYELINVFKTHFESLKVSEIAKLLGNILGIFSADKLMDAVLPINDLINLKGPLSKVMSLFKKESLNLVAKLDECFRKISIKSNGLIKIPDNFNLFKNVLDSRIDAACFVGGTLVETETGLKAIETIQKGEKVYSKDMKSGKIELQMVYSTFVSEKKILYIIRLGNERFEATEEHPFWIEGKGWVNAGNIKLQDRMMDKNGYVIPVDSIETVETSGTSVYNLSVNKNHNYFVGSSLILTHNKNCMANPEDLIEKFKLGDKDIDEILKKGKASPESLDEIIKDLRKSDDLKDKDLADKLEKKIKGVSNLGDARYVGRKIDDALYSKLRHKTPNSSIRDMVNENIDQLIGTPDPAIPGKFITGNLDADHIVSMKKITEMDGFDLLTEAQQVQILNNPENFIGLTKTANTSKGSKSFMEWVTYKKENIDINPEFRAKMIEKESALEKILQKQIDDFNNLTN